MRKKLFTGDISKCFRVSGNWLANCVPNITSSCHEEMYLKRLSFGEICLSSSSPRPDRMGEVSGIVASLNAFVYNTP